MTYLSLYGLYSKKFKWTKYIILIQYIFLIFMFSIAFPYFRDALKSLILSMNYPLNKAVYYVNIEGIRDKNLNFINIEKMQNNNKKFKEILRNTKNVSSVSNLRRSYTLIENSGRKLGAEFLDKNTFSLLTNRGTEDSSKIYAVLFKTPRIMKKYKKDQVYNLEFQIDGKMRKLDVYILDYLDDKKCILSKRMVSNRDFSIDKILNCRRDKDEEAMYMFNNSTDFTKEIDYSIAGFQRVVYFEPDTKQSVIDEFVKK